MNIENIEAFVFVIHCGSFNKAAEALYLSQPSVTARIQSLERELDCKLFNRLGKQVQITEEGKRFLPYAQQLLLTYQKGKLHINKKKSLPEEMKIGCTVSVANYIIPKILPYLKRKFPNTHYKLVTGITEDIVNKVLNKEVDMGFVRNVNHPNLQSIKFYEDPISLYAYEGHPFITDEHLTIEAIAAQPFVFFECGALDWLRIHRIFRNLDVPPNIQIQTDNSEMAKKLVVQKVGISFLPGLCVQQETSDGLLFPIHVPEAEGISLQTNIISNHGEHALFIDAILEVSKELSIRRQILKVI
ncbi:LysR family transcriptional regulator [Paenibacillus baekrokdamisoli]|uniref:LysR family transcriptional regulator n=1 Tax=Paenibacillus baekrokdamisoli TaxID=1712516 RepID=A0A3G9IT68_9BACL|nr:LysR family transcriptional regulator [Paenibacillus baekrokdamisoli]MBB3071157.1 DNA-binding transcriptional LysR family regulator [Paenibacillus baekrokdamisoli]BBH21576.1 LysR family transcriptional regulator [Paenibacillus baekrokdamisoli]